MRLLTVAAIAIVAGIVFASQDSESGARSRGLGWFMLLDQPPGPESAEWGLISAAGAPKPAFRADASVPGD